MKQWKYNYFYKNPVTAVIIIISIFLVGCGGPASTSLDGTWEISSESLQETNTDNSEYQLLSRSVGFSGELLTIATTVDYTDDTVSMSEEELLSRYRYDGMEVEYIERGADSVIVSWTVTGNFSLTDDEKGLVVDGDEYIAPFSRTGKNTILLDGTQYVCKNPDAD